MISRSASEPVAPPWMPSALYVPALPAIFHEATALFSLDRRTPGKMRLYMADLRMRSRILSENSSAFSAE